MKLFQSCFAKSASSSDCKTNLLAAINLSKFCLLGFVGSNVFVGAKFDGNEVKIQRYFVDSIIVEAISRS